MKTHFLNQARWLLSVIFMMLLTTNVWGEEKTSTLTFTAKCNGSGTADDNVSWTITSDGTESTFTTGQGIHYGTSSATVKYIKLSTSDIKNTITKVEVQASAASGVTATVGVKVGETNFTTENNATTASLTTSNTTYTFTGSATGDIEIEITKASNAKKALYCLSVAVTYTDGSGSDQTTV